MSKKGKLFTAFTILITFFSCAGLILIVNRTFKKNLNTMIENQILNSIHTVQNEVEAYNYSNFATIHIAATLPAIRNPDISLKEKGEQLFGVKNADPNLVGLNITDLKGNSYLVEGPMYNFSERAYFKNALLGKETVFGPIYNKVSNVPTIFYGAPLYDDEGNIINTFFLAAHGETLSKICIQNKIGNDSKAVLIRRSTGLIIADVDNEAVLKNNVFDDAAESGIKELQDLTDKIAAGEEGVSFVKVPDGSVIINGYAPISGTDWSVLVRANCADFERLINQRLPVYICFSVFMLILSAAVSFILYRKI
ncbi:cache domain-containing protein [Treponema sp.]|uniref:cache domain-containing protein n=1 Tax=Treponema sp. TaxID=166 RepID=UPI003890C84B